MQYDLLLQYDIIPIYYRIQHSIPAELLNVLP